jgi:hypothetical protein
MGVERAGWPNGTANPWQLDVADRSVTEPNGL